MLSIIIPTKNEEKYLPKLLDSIKKQNIQNIEIIIADANSTDKTREIARNHGCKIVEGGIPSLGRNNGAKQSIKEYIVFIDADVILPKNFLRKSLNKIKERNLDVAGTIQKPIPTDNKFKDLSYSLLYGFTNNWMKITQRTENPCMQICMFVKRSVHEEIGGFNETLIYAEDSEYVKKAVKNGAKFAILNPNKVLVSPRRLENEGLKYILKCIIFQITIAFGHEFTEKSKIKYFK